VRTDEVLGHFERVRQIRGGWVARCPAHQDRRASLSITPREGKTLVHCFAACSPLQVVTAAGLRLSDLFTEPASARRRPSPRRSSIATRSLEASALEEERERRERSAVAFAAYRIADQVRTLTAEANALQELATRLGPDAPAVWDVVEVAAWAERTALRLGAVLESVDLRRTVAQAPAPRSSMLVI
jgi:hypothetical protein